MLLETFLGVSTWFEIVLSLFGCFSCFEEELCSFISPHCFSLQNAISFSQNLLSSCHVSTASKICQKSWLKPVKEDVQVLWQVRGISPWLIPSPPLSLLLDPILVSTPSTLQTSCPHFPLPQHSWSLTLLYFFPHSNYHLLS